MITDKEKEAKQDADLISTILMKYGYSKGIYNNTDNDLFKAMREFAEIKLKQEREALADWIAEVNANGVAGNIDERIELAEGVYYWEYDFDGDHPLSPEKVCEIYQLNKK